MGRTVSLVDLMPTFAALAGDGVAGAPGTSLVGLLQGEEDGWPDRAVIEYLAEGARAPQLTLVRGSWKLVHCPGDPDLLFDLGADPHELHDRAQDPALAGLLADLRAELLEGRDLDALAARVRRSQDERRVVHAALGTGKPAHWDHPPQDAYVRGDFWTAIERGHLDSPQ